MIYKSSQQLGFTLLETMVAIAILLIAVAGPISIIGDSLQKIYFARDQVVAVNLAQEGIEAARQVRDSNFLSITQGGIGNWLTGISQNQDYIVDADASVGPVFISCGSGCSKRVYFYFDGGSPGISFYRQSQFAPGSGWTATPFSRVIAVDNGCTPAATECKVTSTVTWKTGGIIGSVAVSEDLFKWALP